jgi:hypothetical protein
MYICAWRSCLRSNNRADCALLGTLDARVFVDLALVVDELGIGLRADIAIFCILRRRVVRRKNAGYGTHHRTDGLVHCLLLWATDNLRQGRAVVRVGQILVRVEDARVLRQVMVMIAKHVSGPAPKEIKNTAHEDGEEEQRRDVI